MKRKVCNIIIKALLTLSVLPIISTFFVSCGNDDDENIPDVRPTATGTLTDDDGNEYKWVRIGNLDWMAENYRGGEYWVGQYYVTSNGFSSNLTARDEDAAEERFQTLGNYYTYQQAVDLCPEGWRLPTDEDWKNLEVTLGMSKENAEKEGWRDGAGSLLTQGVEGSGLGFGYAGQLSAASTTVYIYEFHVGDYGYYWSSTPDPDVSEPCVYIRRITPALPNKVERISSFTLYRYFSVRYCRDAR